MTTVTPAAKMKNAQKLIKDIEKKIYSWNERSSFKIKGIGNLSKADLDQMVMYCENFNGYDFPGFMKPLGSMREVFIKYQIIEENDNNSW